MVERAHADDGGQGGDEPWSPSPLAIWSQRRVGAGPEEPIAVVLHHPLDPFVAKVIDANDEIEMQQIAHAYLARASELPLVPPLVLAAGWTEALDPANETNPSGPLAWVPMSDDARKREIVSETFSSFQAELLDGGRAFVLHAAEQDLEGGQQFLGSGFGLTVVLHLGGTPGDREVRIQGLNALLPPQTPAWSTAVSPRLEPDFLRTVQRQISSLLGTESFAFRGIRRTGAGDSKYEIHGISRRASAVDEGSAPEPSYPTPFVSDAFVIRGDVVKGNPHVVHREALVADAVPEEVHVFERDAIIRPTREESLLKAWRRKDPVMDPLEGDSDGVSFRILPCPRFVLADRGLDPDLARPVALSGNLPPVRSDDAAATQAFYFVDDFFKRLHAYGINAASYFRFVKPEVRVAYRSGISPGPDKDGQGINARVLPEWWERDQVGSIRFTPRPRLFLLLALGDRRVRARGRWVPGKARMPAQPLGIGADANWMWHEFGHVLLVAATGELELRFAHSPGDALAAIVADPDADDRWRDRPALRYATFPWVATPRRHDRCAEHGWGWGGPIHAPLARVPNSEQPRRKGYLSEQILSSSLFRLYRCLGGDTCPLPGTGLHERRRASHYTLFLIMQAVQLFGDARVAPVTTPEGLVARMSDADAMASHWIAVHRGESFERFGGSASKLIRWSFEAQGLFGLPATSPFGPGAPPPVDLYILSRRPTIDGAAGDAVDYGPGSYVPVSLHWQAGPAAEVPAWQADANAIVIQGGAVSVTVGNRGQVAASGVTVEVWWADWPSTDPVPPAWRDAAWQPSGTVQVATIAPGASITVTPFALPSAAGRRVVLATATSAADRSLVDGTQSLADTPILDLVAGDNNLGLRVVW